MKQSLLKFVRNFGLSGVWLVAALQLYSWYQSDYQLEQTIRWLPREHNYDVPYRMSDGRLVLLTAAVMTAELILLYLILRPWSYRRSIGRLSLAAALSLALMSFSSMSVFGASDYLFFHWMWLLIVNCILVACAVISGGSLLAVKKSKRTNQANTETCYVGKNTSNG